MKLTSTLVHGGLAAVALTAAYFTWQREPESSGESVIVLDAARKELTKVRFDDPSKWIELTPMAEGDGVWVKIGQKDAPDAGSAPVVVLDGGVVTDAGSPGDAGVHAPPPAKPPDRELRGNDFAEKLFKRFAPLRASRGLGVVEESKLGELGLETALRSLAVTTRSKTERFDIGASGLGLSSPYLRAEDGKVFLLGGGVVTEFDMGQGRLADRDLHGFQSNDFDALKVTVGADSREFVLLRGATAAQNKLAPKEAPATADDFTRNWHDKLWRSFAAELLGRGEEPGEKPTVAFRVDYFRGGDSVGFLEFALAKAVIYARTEHTAGWVRLSPGGEGLEIEAKRVTQRDR